MRKRTMLILVDRLFWAIIWLLPLIAFVVMPLGYQLADASSMLPTLSDVLSQFGISTDNVVYTALTGLFGDNGVIHLFADNSVVMLYFTYFVCVELIHLFVDFIIFIPRLTHKWLNILTREGDEL